MPIKAGDWVEVRSREEILATLDQHARLDGMPLMPQMLDYCGRRFQVKKRAHKTCDPIYTMAARRVDRAVHLDLRCSGRDHGGCQAGCLLFWREEWLKPVAAGHVARAPSGDAVPAVTTGHASPPSARCTEADVRRATETIAADGLPRFVCQTTELPEFTRPLAAYDPRQYIEDYISGNESISELLRGGLFVMFGRRFGRRLPLVRKAYDHLQTMTGGQPSPQARGRLAIGAPQPRAPLDLAPGELVRIKSHDEILATLDGRNTHRGLYFDVEMVPYCGKVVRVKTRVERFLDEKTGRMRTLKTPAVILDTVTCRSRFSKCRMFCPRQLYAWWREEWLERVEEPAVQQPDARVPALVSNQP